MGERGPKPHTWDIVLVKLREGSYLDEDGCWIWTGRVAGTMDYGYMRCDGKDYYIHRLVYERMICEELPPIVRHTCDTPRCWNPAHLVGGTQQDNINDMITKGRAWFQNKPNASTHCSNSLTEINSDAITW